MAQIMHCKQTVSTWRFLEVILILQLTNDPALNDPPHGPPSAHRLTPHPPLAQTMIYVPVFRLDETVTQYFMRTVK